MKLKNYIKHATSMTLREFFSGANQLTLFALTLSVTIVCALSLTSSRVENAMINQAADLIGGDRVITSTTDFQPELIEITENYGLRASQSVTLSSMLGANDVFQLSRIRAVDDNYPLKGSIVVRNDKIDDSTDVNDNSNHALQPSVNVQSGPSKGEIWADNKLFNQLNITIGDSVDVGAITLTLTKVLELEPDESGSFYSFFPKALIHSDDLDATQLVLPGSRLRYRLMVAKPLNDGHASVNDSDKLLQQWLDEVTPKLTANQRLIDPENQENRLADNLEKASTFLNLGGLMAIILSGIAISLAATRHAIKNIQAVALLRCLGLKSYQVNIIYGLQLFLIGTIATLLGLLFGYGIHGLLIALIGSLFPSALPDASTYAWVTGPMVAFLMLLGFALPPIFQLAKTPPGRVLRQDNEKSSLKVSYLAVFALIGLILIAWWQTQQFLLALLTITCVVVLVAILLVFITSLFKLFPKERIRNPLWRSSYASISSRPWLSAMQIIGFGLSVFTVALVLYFRSDLFNQWQNEVPEDAPNRFAFDIQTNQKDEFQAQLSTIGLTDNPIFPVTRGRLIKINDEIVQTPVSKENNESDANQGQQQDEALSRDLALTQLTELPYENTLVDGEFYGDLALWNEQHRDESASAPLYPVSIESELAKNIDLSIDDRLEFMIEGRPLNAVVTSIRQVNWQNFHPNFYMIFPDGTLDDFSQTWLASFHVKNDAASNQVENNLSRQFLGITVINVDDILTRIRQILNQVGAAMELITIMTFLAGIAIFWASLLISFDEKQQQTALYRALGANNKTVAKRFMLEHAIIGFISGLLALICLLVVSWAISHFILDIAWGLSWAKWLIIPILLSALLMLLSRWQLRKILEAPPLSILR